MRIAVSIFTLRMGCLTITPFYFISFWIEYDWRYNLSKQSHENRTSPSSFLMTSLPNYSLFFEIPFLDT
jgi:hypothetical protein